MRLSGSRRATAKQCTLEVLLARVVQWSCHFPVGLPYQLLEGLMVRCLQHPIVPTCQRPDCVGVPHCVLVHGGCDYDERVRFLFLRVSSDCFERKSRRSRQRNQVTRSGGGFVWLFVCVCVRVWEVPCLIFVDTNTFLVILVLGCRSTRNPGGG